jgi:hypothetical protein
MGLLDMVVGDAVADPNAHPASVLGMVTVPSTTPPGLPRMVVEEDIDAVRIG